MQHFYILNESSDKSVAGDVNFFSSIETLIISIEAIDVRNGEYFCFTSDGYEVGLSATDDYGPISATTEALPHHKTEVELILRSYLTQLANEGIINIDIAGIESARLAKLVELVPHSLII